MIRTTIKFSMALMLLVNTVSWAQTATTISVGGTEDKYYPVTFTDPEWSTGKPTEIYIGRPDIHMDGSMKGSTLASFKYHTTRWGNQSSFIHATIEKSQNANFFAGWADATTGNASSNIVIWLKGGGMSYLIKSVSTVSVAVYDGVQYALPFLEEGGPARSYKTTIDSYVITGSMSGSSSLVAGNGTFLSNVGIGTTTPSERLELQGKIKINNGFSEPNNESGFRLKFYDNGGVNNDAGLGLSGSGEGSEVMWLNAKAGFRFINGTDGDRLNILANGNVGIGTVSPTGILELQKLNSNLAFDLSTNGLSKIISKGWNASIDMHTFQVNGTENLNQFNVNANGNVGIGTATPNEKLAVNGKIRAKEIKVESVNWPDYVFAEGYPIGTLEELEGYIKANKHLPEMPTAKDVEANGIELGEMNKLLLKKVEELTLLLIDQNKKNEKQDEIINKLVKELDKIKKIK